MSRMLALVLALLALPASVAFGEDRPDRPSPSSDEEAIGDYSVERGTRFLSAVSVNWTRERKCGTCHTNYAHMMAGPLFGKSPELLEVRSFFGKRAAGWDDPDEKAKPIADGEIVATAAALAFYDAASTGKLQPTSRSALDRMWTVQRADGAWDWFDCDLRIFTTGSCCSGRRPALTG